MDSKHIDGVIKKVSENDEGTLRINFWGSTVPKEKLVKLYEHLANNTIIKTMDLSINEIDDENAKILGEALEKNNSIEHINLGFNQIGDKGIIHLCRSLKKNSTLKSLDLSGNQIGNQGLKFILQNIKFCTSLTELNLDLNKSNKTELMIQLSEYLNQRRKGKARLFKKEQGMSLSSSTTNLTQSNLGGKTEAGSISGSESEISDSIINSMNQKIESDLENLIKKSGLEDNDKETTNDSKKKTEIEIDKEEEQEEEEEQEDLDKEVSSEELEKLNNELQSLRDLIDFLILGKEGGLGSGVEQALDEISSMGKMIEVFSGRPKKEVQEEVNSLKEENSLLKELNRLQRAEIKELNRSILTLRDEMQKNLKKTRVLKDGIKKLQKCYESQKRVISRLKK
ncbi:rni-like superfamily protein [Anaeramoeba flamelloides]|uniref:Rni-like superfamily protein n=1 Tax=Anaeramoeba flamelloides TaxID=1746091 RepID=A0AAV7YR70_9EUKA|nr:rni-like superfamily protein [Anaeramoeba flamelloides]